MWTIGRAQYDIFRIARRGIVFSYLKFRTTIDTGGESVNSRRNIPHAVIGAVLPGAPSAHPRS
ncbi:hypothetical protein A8F72_25210 [Burkholderia cenocepacia]|nr:hypothetical protein A8F32_19705 [Burkholderia cenocepacia]PRF45134.1 hypothetical protein C6Q10_02640 [Burkholderia multivorans]ONJ04191.1 hypothetical protein A8F33_23805 [Burkholderia cenocepacia]ONJ09539.1 hypothetical protein A8F53_00785 [Burkholderia cenocepacia]ONJ29280.1 hypothetical protein A8F38_17445 [Burkholderia cenocepacia]